MTRQAKKQTRGTGPRTTCAKLEVPIEGGIAREDRAGPIAGIGLKRVVDVHQAVVIGIWIV